MHRNTLWALEQERRRLGGRSPRAILISHVVHTKTETQFQDDLWGFFTPAVQMLKTSLENKVFVVGMSYGGGEYWKDWQKGPDVRQVAPIPKVGENIAYPSLEATLGTISRPNYFLPWASAPFGAQPWLSSLCSMRENDYIITLRPNEWDACIFMQKAQPATPAT